MMLFALVEENIRTKLYRTVTGFLGAKDESGATAILYLNLSLLIRWRLFIIIARSYYVPLLIPSVVV